MSTVFWGRFSLMMEKEYGMQYLDWAAQHPVLACFLAFMACQAIRGIGRIGSTRVFKEIKDKDS